MKKLPVWLDCWKGKNVLIAFSYNCGYSSLIETKLNKWSFLNSSLVKFEKILVKRLVMVKFKFFNLYALIMNPLLMHSFIAIFTGHLENVGSVSYADLPNFDTFHFTIAKNHIY